MSNTIIPQMWTVNEAAEKTNLTPFFVRELIHQNRIKYIRTGRKYLINAESLCDLLTQCQKEGDA